MMIKSRDEILFKEYHKLIANPKKCYEQNPYIIKAAHRAMYIFAQKEAIGFVKWVMMGEYSVDGRFQWEIYDHDHIPKGKYNTKQLYQLFLQSKQK